jgi:hypothetical protein
MGQKLPENERELYKRIDEVLHYLWDPFGVSDVPMARNEYYNYLPEIFRLAKLKSGENEIAEYLNSVLTKHMELDSNIESCKQIAKIIMNWSEVLNCHH